MREKKPPINLVGLILLTIIMSYAALNAGPLFIGREVQAMTAIIYGVTAIAGLRTAIALLDQLAGLIEWCDARRVTGKDGTASWVTWKVLKEFCSKNPLGPFWGILAGTKKAIFADFASNAMCIAPAGSGKGIYNVIPNILSIRASKVIADFKGELACICKKTLEKRGEIVRILNPANLWSDMLGEGDCYNPLDLIVDDLFREGGLRDVPDDLREMAMQLYDEPKSGGENAYWRKGSRKLLADGILIEAMLEGYDATLSSASLLLEDRQSFEYHLRWILGIDLEGKPLPEGPMPIEHMEWAKHHRETDLSEFIRTVRARASNVLSLMTSMDSRTYDSFVSGAQQALAPFSFGRVSPSMGRSTFSMSDLKDQIVSLFIISDASRPEAFKAYNGLIQWSAMTALKRHQKKDTPVYFILDEATNYVVNGLIGLLTWGRAYSLKLLIVFQDLTAFEKAYGEKSLETLLSECEIKCFLPGQRSPKTLALIKKLLGEQGITASTISQHKLSEASQEQPREAGRPLMTEDEIRRSDHALLIVDKAPPALVEPVSYAEIAPWRKQVDINPFHGKPFLKPVKLRIKEPRA